MLTDIKHTKLSVHRADQKWSVRFYVLNKMHIHCECNGYVILFKKGIGGRLDGKYNSSRSG